MGACWNGSQNILVTDKKWRMCLRKNMKINQFSKLDLSLKEFNWLVVLSKSRKKFKEKLLYEKKRDDRELIYRVGEVINIDTFTQLTHI